MKSKPAVTTIDEYLATVRADQRAALQKLRKIIKSALPEAEECINYGIAAFKLNGQAIAGFAASANHCAYYPMSGHTVAQFKDDLKKYQTSKGAVQFQPDQPLSAALVKKLVKARIADTQTATTKGQKDPAVDAFLRSLDHPLKKDIETVRKLILAVSPDIKEGIKWNSPSFRTSDYFATVFLRATESVQLIFHKGAKAKGPVTKSEIADPLGLIEWLAADRCKVTVGAGKEIKTNRKAIERIVRDWLKQM